MLKNPVIYASRTLYDIVFLCLKFKQYSLVFFSAILTIYLVHLFQRTMSDNVSNIRETGLARSKKALLEFNVGIELLYQYLSTADNKQYFLIFFDKR